MTRFRIIFTVVVVAVAAIVSLLIQQRAQATLRVNEEQMRQQELRLAEANAENQRLSNEVVQADWILQARSNSTALNDSTTELAQLRSKVEALRQLADQLAKQVAESRQAAGTQFYSNGDFNLLEHNRESSITFAGGPREAGKLNDARALAAAMRQYATEHQGELPLNLAQVTPYLPKPLQPESPGWANAPLSGTNDFEIVYHGSQSDLTNIPLRRVALLRERQPWLSPDGKWVRVYAYADGAASSVESDDNFQSWEAQHIVPPQSNTR